MNDEKLLSLLMAESAKLRFDAKVVRVPGCDCWLWGGSMQGMGYGFFHVGGKFDRKGMKAHRASWVYAHGVLPPSDMHVCHTCDNRMCVNPDHLFIGTKSDNMRDCASKGRICTIGKSKQTHCLRGHEFTPENTRVDNFGHRRCLICERNLRKVRDAIRARSKP